MRNFLSSAFRELPFGSVNAAVNAAKNRQSAESIRNENGRCHGDVHL